MNYFQKKFMFVLRSGLPNVCLNRANLFQTKGGDNQPWMHDKDSLFLSFTDSVSPKEKPNRR